MKRIAILILTLAPILTFAQGAPKLEIDWIPLEKAIKFAEKYNQNILIFFYKEHCPYCEEMEQKTLSDNSIINLINNNFLPVKINSRTKDTIYYNDKSYTNQQPVSDGYTWRHDFYAEVTEFTRNNTKQSTTPTIVLFNNNFGKIRTFPGKQPKQLLLRNLKPYVLN